MPTTCPSADLLNDFALGRGDPARFVELERHIEACDDCQRRLEQWDRSPDPLVTRLGRLTGTSASRMEANEAWVESLVERRVAADAGKDLARRLLQGAVRLDRFELQAELGVGSFGYVFQAWDPRLERIVALKVQRSGSLASPEEAERFLREARSVARLKHPSIVSLYETGVSVDDVLFLVCEHIDGETLEEKLRAGPIPAAQAAIIASELADALHYAHQQGVIHRDVKPSNILLDRQQHAHVTDFGLAKRDSGELSMTSDGRILGTPAYMSPEQAAGASHEVDARSDLYSLGVVLYEMLTGERPFHGNRRLLLLQVLEDDPRPPRAVRPDVPRDLEVICLMAMAKSPTRRYGTAGELADDLRRYRTGQTIVARPMGHAERMLRWCRRYPLAVSVIVAVMAGSIGGLWHLSSLSEYFVRQTALESARLETKMLDEVWRFYSDEISDIDAKTNVAITENYRHVHPALPLPATFAIDLGERISRRHPGMEVRVYSRYPWPTRRDGGPQDALDELALEKLETGSRNSDESPDEFAQFVSVAGRRKLVYYSAPLDGTKLPRVPQPSAEPQSQKGLEARRRRRRTQDRTAARSRNRQHAGRVARGVPVDDVDLLRAARDQRGRDRRQSSPPEGWYRMTPEHGSSLPNANDGGSSGATSRGLLADARLVSPAAWERLVRLYAPLVASWCRHRNVADQDVGDVVQDVFASVSRHLANFRKERPSDTFRGWLATITRSKIHDHYRRRSSEPRAAGGTEATLRWQDLPDPHPLGAPETTDDPRLEELFLNDLLHRALDAIRTEFHARTWQAFWGVVVDGRATADVAADLGMQPGAVRVAKSRVLLRLRQELGEPLD